MAAGIAERSAGWPHPPDGPRQLPPCWPGPAARAGADQLAESRMPGTGQRSVSWSPGIACRPSRITGTAARRQCQSSSAHQSTASPISEGDSPLPPCLLQSRPAKYHRRIEPEKIRIQGQSAVAGKSTASCRSPPGSPASTAGRRANPALPQPAHRSSPLPADHGRARTVQEPHRKRIDSRSRRCVHPPAGAVFRPFREARRPGGWKSGCRRPARQRTKGARSLQIGFLHRFRQEGEGPAVESHFPAPAVWQRCFQRPGRPPPGRKSLHPPGHAPADRTGTGADSPHRGEKGIDLHGLGSRRQGLAGRPPARPLFWSAPAAADGFPLEMNLHRVQARWWSGPSVKGQDIGREAGRNGPGAVPAGGFCGRCSPGAAPNVRSFRQRGIR